MNNSATSLQSGMMKLLVSSNEKRSSRSNRNRIFSQFPVEISSQQSFWIKIFLTFLPCCFKINFLWRFFFCKVKIPDFHKFFPHGHYPSYYNNRQIISQLGTFTLSFFSFLHLPSWNVRKLRVLTLPTIDSTNINSKKYTNEFLHVTERRVKAGKLINENIPARY